MFANVAGGDKRVAGKARPTGDCDPLSELGGTAPSSTNAIPADPASFS
jgi:hypothetical protein